MLKDIKILVKVLAALFIFIVISGCAGNIPEAERMDYIDANWGKSFEAAKNNQILNPQASENLAPVEGIDGETTNIIMEGYRNSFIREKKGTATTKISSGFKGSSSEKTTTTENIDADVLIIR